MKNHRPILLACFLLSLSFVQAQNPGGIGPAHLMLWLKGDAGVTTGATFTWADQSGHGRNGVQSTAAAQPTVTTATADYMNYNPGLKFVANQWLITGSAINTAGTTANEVFLVYKEAPSTPDGFVLGTETPGNRFYFYGSGVAQFGNSGKPPVAAPGYVTNGANLFAGKFFTAADAAHAANGASFFALAPAVAPATFTTPVAVGVQPSNSGGFNAFGYTGNTMEVVSYDAEIDLTGTLRQQVESYLALKYGITLDSVGTGGNYYNSAGGSVYTGGGGNGYFTNIIGIARDDNSTLLQRQSHLASDSVRLYLGATPLAAATNQANGNGFAADNSYIVMGDNQGSLCANGSASALVKPASVISRLGREWKITYNSTANTFNMDIMLASCAYIATGTYPAVSLELLYSTSSSSLAGGIVMANNTNGMSMTITNGVVTIAGLNSALAAMAAATPGGTTVYFTLAATDFNVLPLEITAFTAIAAGGSAKLDWSASAQSGGERFLVERSADGAQWQQIGTVAARGLTAGSADYQFQDSLPFRGANYYRLEELGENGSAVWSPVREVVFGGGVAGLHVYPNPATDEVYVAYSRQGIAASDIRLMTVTGQALPAQVQGGRGTATVSLRGLAAGIYLLQVRTATGWEICRVLKN
jgi:Secretion system C-terminal sorting domain